MKSLLVTFAFIIVSMTINSCGGQKEEPQNETVKKVEDNAGRYVKVVYYHGDKRCPTCMRIEEFSTEAVKTFYKNEMENGNIVWETINYDQKGNEHYMDDYELYNQSLIISVVEDGSEKQWKNCEKIWEINDDKEKFLDYVKEEVDKYLKEI